MDSRTFLLATGTAVPSVPDFPTVPTAVSIITSTASLPSVSSVPIAVLITSTAVSIITLPSVSSVPTAVSTITLPSVSSVSTAVLVTSTASLSSVPTYDIVTITASSPTPSSGVVITTFSLVPSLVTITSTSSRPSVPPVSRPIQPASIAGAIIGSLAGVTAFLLAGWIILRRRKRLNKPAPPVSNEGYERAMLHSDDLKPDRKELTGDEPDAKVTTLWNATHGSAVELPANENAGAELDAANVS